MERELSSEFDDCNEKEEMCLAGSLRLDSGVSNKAVRIFLPSAGFQLEKLKDTD